MKKISIVTTMFKSEDYIDEFYRRSCDVLKTIGVDDYEFIFVDDGSPDDSLKRAVALHEADASVKVIELSRNFGHHKAIMTGLAHAKGDYVFLIDIDLEEEPELLETFWNEIHQPENKGLDVIQGVQKKRKGGVFERISGGWFYRLFNRISGVKIPVNSMIVRLMTKRYVEALVAHRDRAIFFAGLAALTGYEQKTIACKKTSKGSTTYNLSRKATQAVDSITSFSSRPLHYVFYLGALISGLSFLYILYLVIQKLFFASLLSGWTSLIISVFFMGGLILLCLGIVGIYISRVFDEVKDRPYTLIKRKWE